ncbi:MAG: hypothetical protein AAGF88_09755 [Pseudomonadota bacterium]
MALAWRHGSIGGLKLVRFELAAAAGPDGVAELAGRPFNGIGVAPAPGGPNYADVSGMRGPRPWGHRAPAAERIA